MRVRRGNSVVRVFSLSTLLMVESESLPIEIIPSTLHPDRLYWISDRSPPRNRPNSYYFCVDNVPFT